jgi:nucleoside-diphosphate-sugar epimerase
MPNVLVIGATGYIGSALCQQLIRSGNHEVFGLSKSGKESFNLALKEIIPLTGSVEDSNSFLALINSGKIDVIVETNSFNNDTTKLYLLEMILGAAKERLATALEHRTFKGPKLGFVTVSGIWSHGSTEDPHGSFQPATQESLGTVPPAGLPDSKVQYEQKVLEATAFIDVAIIQPSFVWARGGAAWTKILKLIVDATRTGSTDIVRIPVDPTKSVYSFTNIDDVATALELAIDKIQIINGSSVYPVFELVGDQFPIELLCKADAGYFGCKGEIELYKPEGISFLDSIGGSPNARPTRAEQILRWVPKKRHFLRDTRIYANAFLAALALAKEK